MTKKFSFFILLISVFFACKQEVDVFIPTVIPPQKWVKFDTINFRTDVETFLESLNSSPETTTGDASKDITCKFSNAEVFIPKGSLLNSVTNAVVTSGIIEVEFILVNKLGDIIKNNRPTVTAQYGLTTGGSYYIKIKQAGVELVMDAGKTYTVKFLPSYGINAKPMLPFEGIDGTGASRIQNIWNPITDKSRIDVVQDSIFRKYICTMTKLHWINCDVFADTTKLTTPQITIDSSLTFTNINTSVFVVLKDISSVVGLAGDPTTKTFNIPNGYKGLPIGANVSIISMTKIGNDYFYSILPTKIEDSKNFTMKPNKSSLAEIKADLDKL
jgi:hypothetical protein